MDEQDGYDPSPFDAPAPTARVQSVYVSATYGEKVSGELFTKTIGETLSFDPPIDVTFAAAARTELDNRLKAEVRARVEAEIEQWKATRPTPQQPGNNAGAFVSQHQAMQQVPAAPGITGTGISQLQQVGAGQAVAGGGWAEGQNPKGALVRYIDSRNLPTAQFVAAMQQAWEQQGLPAHVASFFDNRVGDRGLEAGKANYSPGAIRLKESAPGFQFLAGQRKTTIGYASFNDNGQVIVKVSKDYQGAVEMLRSMGQDPFAMAEGF